VSSDVLVVDDDEDWRLLVRLALDRHPSIGEIAEVATGAAAISRLAEIPADLVLLECSLPGGDAFDALPGIRSAAPQARVILVSAHSPAEIDRAVEASGAVGHLSKTAPASKLAEELVALGGLVDELSRVLEEASARLAGETTSPREARRFVAERLGEWSLEDLADTVTLLVSELVTNAVVHADSEPQVVVRLTPEVVRVEVSDRSRDEPERRGGGAEDESGRGLLMVETLARRWGIRRHPAGGKTVWFEVARPDAPPG
jgi:DNA-binding NarL/FixJ family response regulator